ncbi:Rha family transcriptional regulator [uncultured Paraglaciecola sp.]|uniref:Rha family transcriptional regulator n=1 Tax=uncultured Paraglaciecola sp. TaxID=1765024 RepID=UPI0026294CD6|nr:Rha family transcriptional regulator [uncultured Paraglaciecola sp.]
MVNTLPDVDLRQYIDIQNNQLITQSTHVAEVFNKPHKDVLTKIRKLDCSEYFNGRNFSLVKYKDLKGEMRDMYNVTKDGFMFLVMGFTGKQAAAIKEAYINAFNVMAEQLTAQPANHPAINDLQIRNQQLQDELLDMYRDKVKTLESKPKRPVSRPKSKISIQAKKHHALKTQAFTTQALAIIQSQPGINKTALLIAMGYAKDNKQARAMLAHGEGKYWSSVYNGSSYAYYVQGVTYEQ